ncbi:MAG: NYN domain-containing protein [Gammaproteobacteria bacterium]|nr:NYN domain-containing protein [Gammaproteobacteria bacterium]
MKLSKTIVRDYQTVISVNYYSAFAKHRGEDPLRRHQAYVRALKQSGVRVVMGVFKGSPQRCKTCGARWTKYEEKESDVRIVADIVSHALLDKFDDAMLISADSDMAPAKEHIDLNTPNKNIFVVAPPGRFGHARDLNPIIEATKGRIAKSLFPEVFTSNDGQVIVRRPSQYDPP